MCLVFDEYVVYKHVPEEGKEKLPARNERDINKKHFEMFHECLEVIGRDPEIGYDFKL